LPSPRFPLKLRHRLRYRRQSGPGTSHTGGGSSKSTRGCAENSPGIAKASPGSTGVYKEPSKVLTLNECIKTSIMNRPDLQALQQQILAAKAVVGINMSSYYPLVTFSSSYIRNGAPDRYSTVTTSSTGAFTTGAGAGVTTSVISGVSTSFADSLIVQQLITDFGRTANQVTASQQSYVATLYGYITLRNQIIDDIKKAYYNCIAAQDLFSVKQEM